MLGLLQEGLGYDEIGRALGIHPGLAYLIATGVPADGSDSFSPAELLTEGLLDSSQHLSNPKLDHPTQKESTREWVRRRAARDLVPSPAAAAAPPKGDTEEART